MSSQLKIPLVIFSSLTEILHAIKGWCSEINTASSADDTSLSGGGGQIMNGPLPPGASCVRDVEIQTRESLSFVTQIRRSPVYVSGQSSCDAEVVTSVINLSVQRNQSNYVRIRHRRLSALTQVTLTRVTPIIENATR